MSPHFAQLCKEDFNSYQQCKPEKMLAFSRVVDQPEKT